MAAFSSTINSWIAVLLTLPVMLSAQTKVYIDPGHGGTDSGNVNQTFGTEESERALFTALELRDYLDADTMDFSGGGVWEVRLSRTSDATLSLAARTSDANSFAPDAFISIHQNAFNNAVNGTETYSVSNLGDAGRLRELVQDESVEAWGLFNRGGKVGELSYLSGINAPAVLTQMGFIDSPTDHDFISSDDECSRYALGLLFALQRFENLPEYEPSVGVTDEIIVDNDDLTGYIETGSWSNTNPSFGAPFGQSGRYAAVFGTDNTATWTPDFAQSGEYDVAVYYVSGSNRSSAAAYTIQHAEGQETVFVNQQFGGQQWNYIGTWNFFGGTQGRVTLDAGLSSNNGFAAIVMADAVRFQKVDDYAVETTGLWLFW